MVLIRGCQKRGYPRNIGLTNSNVCKAKHFDVDFPHNSHDVSKGYHASVSKGYHASVSKEAGLNNQSFSVSKEKIDEANIRVKTLRKYTKIESSRKFVESWIFFGFSSRKHGCFQLSQTFLNFRLLYSFYLKANKKSNETKLDPKSEEIDTE